MGNGANPRSFHGYGNDGKGSHVDEPVSGNLKKWRWAKAGGLCRERRSDRVTTVSRFAWNRGIRSPIRYNNFRKLKSKQKKTWFAALW